MQIKNKIKRIYYRLIGVNTVNIVAYKKMGLQIGENCKIMGGVAFDYGHCKHISIGDNVTIVPEAYLLAHDASTKRELGYTRIGKINIEDNVFIGLRAIIMPNVCIGKNSIVGAGAVVIKDVPPNKVVVGNPAKIICNADEYIIKRKKEMTQMPIFGEEYTERIIKTEEERVQKSLYMNKQMKEGIGYVE